MRRALPALAAAAALASCGNPGGDLIAIEVRDPAGGTPTQRLVVTDDGRGSCNGGELERLHSDRLLDAREVERESADLVADDARPRAIPNRRAYRIVTREGSVGFSEGDRTDPVFAKATALALVLRRELCP